MKSQRFYICQRQNHIHNILIMYFFFSVVDPVNFLPDPNPDPESSFNFKITDLAPDGDPV